MMHNLTMFEELSFDIYILLVGASLPHPFKNMHFVDAPHEAAEAGGKVGAVVVEV